MQVSFQAKPLLVRQSEVTWVTEAIYSNLQLFQKFYQCSLDEHIHNLRNIKNTCDHKSKMEMKRKETEVFWQCQILVLGKANRVQML